MKFLSSVLVLFILTACENGQINSKNTGLKEQREIQKVEIIDSTTLKNKGLLKRIIIGDDQFLLLEFSGKVVDTLAACSKGLPSKNLGYLVHDLENNFVFAQSFGSGNPHNVYLYNKKSGVNELNGEFNFFIDIDEISETLFYSSSDLPTVADTLFSINMINGEKTHFSFPQIVFGEAEMFNRIKVSKVNGNDVYVQVEYQNWTKKKELKLTKK